MKVEDIAVILNGAECAGGGPHECFHCGALEAWGAIKNAAHLVTVVGQSEAHVDRYDEWKAACELLRSITKEAP